MAAPTYSTDLTDMLLDMPSTTGWSAIGGGAAGLNAPETDYFIQGNDCISKNAWTSATKGMIYDYGSGITIPTDGAVLMWMNHLTPNSLAVKASGGIQLLIGSSSSAYYHWYVEGSDTNVFGGWSFAAVNNTISVDATTGSPGATLQFFGGVANLPTGGPTKGAPFAIDAFRYGRCELRSVDGDITLGYATFDGAETYGDNVTRRWGLLSFSKGAYYMSGLFVFGTATTAVDFRDSNRAIFLRDHDRVTAAFNGLEVRHASSNVELSSISFKALGTTSPGAWITTDNATIVLAGCAFTDMGAFSFLTNLTATGTTWRGCGAITAAGSSITTCLIAESSVAADSSALIWDVATDPNGLLDDCAFTKGATLNHAIEFGTTSPLTMTLTGITFTGYNASNGQTDSTLYIARTTGTVTINISGGTTPSYKSAGATVVIVSGAVSATVTCKTTAGVVIENARVFLKASDGTGPFPFEESVTIANSGTTATVTHATHGMLTNDKVVIEGASHWQNNGVFQITVTGVSEYTYTLPSDPGSSPTGTITSTFVVLEGLTNVSGLISMSRVFSTDQPVEGWARKSTSSPYFKTGQMTGAVDSVDGFAATVVMVSDE